MKIAISGAQSTGKTTILDKLKEIPELSKTFIFLSEITREVKQRGFEINEFGDNTTQLLILNSHLDRFYKYKDVILDRCILDGVVYTKYLYLYGFVDKWVVDYAEQLFIKLIHEYDIIFYIIPEIGITNDGVRSCDMLFRKRIIDIFNYYIQDCNNISYIKGSVVDRVTEINNTIKEKIEINKKIEDNIKYIRSK